MKTLFTSILLLIVTCSLTFSGLYYSFNLAEPNNFLNQELRPFALSLPIAKNLFRLNRIGDAAPEYFSDATDQITIEIDTTPDLSLNPMLETRLDEIIETTVAKSTYIMIDDQHPIPSQTTYSDDDLHHLIQTQTHVNRPGQAYLHIIYLSQSSAVPTNAGRVVNHDTIFMFQSVINRQSSQSHIRDRLEKSTLMHEYAHLLGLEHIDQANCIMSQTVEVNDNNRYQAGNIPVDFCPETLFQLQQLRRQYR